MERKIPRDLFYRRFPADLTASFSRRTKPTLTENKLTK